MDWVAYKTKIEQCLVSFFDGRRNSDLVNWGIAYIAINRPEDPYDLVKSFTRLFGAQFDAAQKSYLADYDWVGKLHTVFGYYAECSDEELENLLIDVEY